MGGLFSKIKEKLIGNKEEEETKEEKEYSKNKKEENELDKPTKEQIVTKKETSPQQSPVDTQEALEEWKEQVQYAENHPLTQAKIINSNLLRNLTDVLERMDTKLNKLDKLDQILGILKESQKELEEKGVSSQKLNKAIEQMENLTVKDKEVLKVVKNKQPITASQLAEKIDVSRSTASSRLNKLASLGVLNKEPEGRKMLFSADLE